MLRVISIAAVLGALFTLAADVDPVENNKLEGLETTDLHYAKALIEVLNGDSVVRAWPGSPGPSI